MTITLKQVRDWLVEVRKRNAVNATLDDLDDHDADAIILAIDAHIAAIREVIAHLRSFRSNTPPTWAHLDDAADRLEAAIKGAA